LKTLRDDATFLFSQLHGAGGFSKRPRQATCGAWTGGSVISGTNRRFQHVSQVFGHRWRPFQQWWRPETIVVPTTWMPGRASGLRPVHGPRKSLGFPARAAVKATSRPKQRGMFSAWASMSAGICMHGVGRKRSTWFHVSLGVRWGAQEDTAGGVQEF
jgi:hypothetical protein